MTNREDSLQAISFVAARHEGVLMGYYGGLPTKSLNVDIRFPNALSAVKFAEDATVDLAVEVHLKLRRNSSFEQIVHVTVIKDMS